MLKISDLLKVIDEYKLATGLTDSSVATYVFNQGTRIKTLRAGGGIGIDKFNFALSWFSSRWPEDVPWPADVPRPPVGAAAVAVVEEEEEGN